MFSCFPLLMDFAAAEDSIADFIPEDNLSFCDESLDFCIAVAEGADVTFL